MQNLYPCVGMQGLQSGTRCTGCHSYQQFSTRRFQCVNCYSGNHEEITKILRARDTYAALKFQQWTMAAHHMRWTLDGMALC